MVFHTYVNSENIKYSFGFYCICYLIGVLLPSSVSHVINKPRPWTHIFLVENMNTRHTTNDGRVGGVSLAPNMPPFFMIHYSRDVRLRAITIMGTNS